MPRALRFIRAAQYACYALAGVLGAIQPSVILASTITSDVIYGWVILLGVGALFCLWGAARGSWLGEYVGLGPMIFALGGYGLLVLGTAVVMNPAAFLAAFLYLAVTAGLVARWVEVMHERKLASQNRRPRGD